MRKSFNSELVNGLWNMLKRKKIFQLNYYGTVNCD